MERAVAVKRLRKMLGPKFGYEINPQAASPEEQAAAKAKQPYLIAERRAASDALEARLKAILNADEEYQALKVRVAEARKACDKNNGILFVHKITVGRCEDMFFHVDAQGHSWEEIFRILERNKERR